MDLSHISTIVNIANPFFFLCVCLKILCTIYNTILCDIAYYFCFKLQKPS